MSYIYVGSVGPTVKILPILKKNKDPTDPSSYRPISLLPNISKVFESLLNTSITSHCNQFNIIPSQQFGFRYKHSTVHAINKFLTDTTHQLNNHGMVAAGLIDLEKAFDSVWLKGLFFKMIKKGFPRHLIKIIWTSMQSRKFITVSNSS